MKLLKNFIHDNSAFTAIGSLLGTLLFTLSFHLLIFLDDPNRFLHGLITPHIIFPMLLAFVFILPFGYFIGLLPALVSKLLFEHFYAVRIGSASFYRATLYGLMLGLMWSPIILILDLAAGAGLKFFLYVEFVLIFPVCLVCNWIEWKKAMNPISNSLKE